MQARFLPATDQLLKHMPTVAHVMHAAKSATSTPNNTPVLSLTSSACTACTVTGKKLPALPQTGYVLVY